MNRRIRLVKPIADADATEPSMEELAAIAREWPLIAAEVAVVDAEIRLACTDWPSQLDQVRLRRAHAQLDRIRAVVGHRADSPGDAHGGAA